MRLALVTVALFVSSGCVRFGYDALLPKSDRGPDAAHGGSSSAGRAGQGGAAGTNGSDAGSAEAGSSGGSTSAADGGGSARAGMGASGMAGTAGSAGDAALPSSMDGGLSDAGSADGSTDAAVGDGGKSLKCDGRTDQIYCTDFEDPEDSWDYVITQNGTIGLTNELARSGNTSVRATTGDASVGNAARWGRSLYGTGVTLDVGQSSGDVWFRYYYYLPSSVEVTKGFSTGVVAEGAPPFFGFALIVRSDHLDIGVFGTMYPGDATFPRDRWTCVELHVRIDAQGVFEAYLDGAVAVTSPATNTVPASGYLTADIGVHYADSGQGPVVAYVDDVMAGRERPGCD